MGKEVFGISITPGKLYAGGKLTGTVWADFEKDAKGSSLTLEFSGTEQTLVRHRREENNHPDNSATSSDYYMKAIGKRNLILVNLPVESTSFIQNQTIAAGKYELPFSVDLPKILPSSCRAEYDGSYCEIVYILKAEIQGSGIVQNYKAKVEIPVEAAPLSREAIPYAVPPEMEAINFLCCISQGAITVAARVADTKLDQGEILNVGLACRNDSSSEISAITITLVQDCKWEAERYNMANKDILGEVKLDPKTIVKTGTADERTLLKEMEETNASFATPMTAIPSYAGQLMSIQHHVEIVFSTGAMTSNPTIKIPVQVGPAVQTETNSCAANLPEGFSGTKIEIPDSDVVVLGSGDDASKAKTVEGLIQGITDSVQDLAYVQECVKDGEWKSAVFAKLSPTDYGRVLKSIGSEFEQPAVATTLASAMDGFSCAHVVAALQNCAEWSRGSITEKLLPLCTDLTANSGLIKAQLTEWEQMVTEPAFASALDAA